MRHLFIFASVFALDALNAQEAVPTAHPVVVELFTSQGCSSCPPADALAEQLAHRPDLVVITRPVTYWDRLGWKDTLARDENTRLQQAYAARGGEVNGVYTPQTMVQGRYGAVGSNHALISRQIATARNELSAALAIRTASVGVAGKGAPADIKLIYLKSSVPVKIGSGENGGRVVRYSNVVVGERTIGRWKGGAESFALPADTPSGVDRAAIILQVHDSGPILAAGYR